MAEDMRLKGSHLAIYAMVDGLCTEGYAQIDAAEMASLSGLSKAAVLREVRSMVGRWELDERRGLYATVRPSTMPHPYRAKSTAAVGWVRDMVPEGGLALELWARIDAQNGLGKASRIDPRSFGESGSQAVSEALGGLLRRGLIEGEYDEGFAGSYRSVRPVERRL